MSRLFALVLLMIIPLSILAQDYPQYNVFAGYSYLRTDAQNISSNQTKTSVDRSHGNLNGWNGAFTYNFSEYLGVTADFAGNYGTVNYHANDSDNEQAFKVPVDTRIHTFLFGPQVSAELTPKTRLFARVILGVGRIDQSVNLSGQSFDTDDTGFATSIGAGVDFELSKHLSVRPLQVDYLLTRFNPARLGNDTQHNFRYAGGLVFHP